MRSTTRIVNGFEFGFTYGDAFGLSGLVIPPSTDLSSYGFMFGLAQAQNAARDFCSICSLFEWIECNDIRDASDDRLNRLLNDCVKLPAQTFWDVEEFEVNGLAIIDRLRHNILTEMTNRTHVARQKEELKVKKTGYVYLLQSPTRAYKIGRTVNPNNRLKTFSVKLPFEVSFTAVIQTDDMFQLESDLHSKFADKRVNGEWFTLSPEDVEYIKGLAS